MLLAELEIWHTRPLTPTRRVSLGHPVLPADPAPGFGGLLLAGVVARHSHDIDDDLLPDFHRLIGQIENAERVAQPRLRHRFQVDRHGLARSTHRLVREGDEAVFEFHSHGSPMQMVLGAIYALERLDTATRAELTPLLKRSLSWRGPIGRVFIDAMMGTRASKFKFMGDPRAWALDVLGFPVGTVKPSRGEVMSRFRTRLREVHPDHGGSDDLASSSIDDLSEARRILTS